jgi:hypothetical protein
MGSALEPELESLDSFSSKHLAAAKTTGHSHQLLGGKEFHSMQRVTFGWLSPDQSEAKRTFQ